MIAVIDYGMGNLRSVQKGLQRVGGAAEIVADPAQLAGADKVVLPGVGAFRDAIATLRDDGWVEPIRQALESGRPFLGICLGLQLLFDVSHEDGQWPGLGALSGDVVRFDLADEGLKVPHMGWNQIRWVGQCPLLEGVEQGSYVYFVHSYHVRPNGDAQAGAVSAITSDYGTEFVAGIWRDNLFATQFHPEKSQTVGLKILENFVHLRR